MSGVVDDFSKALRTVRRNPLFALTVALALSCLSSAGCDETSRSRSVDLGMKAPCAVADTPSLAGRVRTVEAENGICTLVLRASGVTLETSEAREIDVRGPIVRSSSGEYFAASYSGYVNRWNAEGAFVGRLGERGPGPYRYRSASGVLIDHADTVHVSDLPGRWHVLDDSGHIVRTILGPSLANREGIAFLDDGRVLMAVPNPPFSAIGKRYVILDRADGSVLTSFDPRAFSSPLMDARHIAYAGGDRFWAVSPTRYELELWNTDGTQLGGIRRQVSWFRDSDEGLEARSGSRIAYIFLDESGILWVVTLIFKGSLDDDTQAPPSERYSTHVEAFNSYTGELLVSRRFDNPLEFYPGLGSNLAYAVELDDTGLVHMHIVEYELLAEPAQE